MRNNVPLSIKAGRVSLLLLLAIGFLLGLTSRAEATTEFHKIFVSEYLKDHPDKKFAKFAKRKAKCYVCHVGEKNKHENVYGKHLAKLLDHEADKDNDEKIIAALHQVGPLPYDPAKPDGETFDARIAASKLPGGDDLDELKKEPEGSDEEGEDEDEDTLHQVNTPVVAADGFVPLFDGKTLDGWIGKKSAYEVRDNALFYNPKLGRGNLYTEKEYSDFVLRFDFQLTPGTNNGLGIRAPLKGDVAYAGIELQILDNSAKKYAKLKPYQFHGSPYGIAAAKRGFLKPVGEWNHQEVRCQGRQITVILNGTTILDVNLDEAAPDGKTLDEHKHPGLKRTTGHLAFLSHGDPVGYRNLEIKELSSSDGSTTKEDK